MADKLLLNTVFHDLYHAYQRSDLGRGLDRYSRYQDTCVKFQRAKMVCIEKY